MDESRTADMGVKVVPNTPLTESATVSSAAVPPAGGSEEHYAEHYIAAKISADLHVAESEITPRWPALIAALCVAGLSAALPDALQVGPRWLLPGIIALLLLPTLVSFRTGKHLANQIWGYILCGAITLALCLSLAQLLFVLPLHREDPLQMLQSAGALWITNILVFALWYWRLDAGGPHLRDAHPTHFHCNGAFLFPQMTLDGYNGWSPHFMDYLFLAFNTSTAFSPTDAPVLSRWAKALMMLQSLISLLILVLLAARAVNIL